MSRKHDLFASIHTEGSLLPADFLKKIAEGHKDVDGLEPEAFDLANERLNTAVARAWNRLQAAWTSFKVARTSLAGEDAAATGLTREKWLLQVFMALDYGKLAQARGLKVKDKDYAISHLWRHVPIHLVGFGVDLDRRQKGVAGAARLSPHGLVQDFLNQEDGSLWGIVSNGLRLRLLRDNLSLSRQAYVEFDLEAMFEGQLYADFHLFWTLCHQSRVNAEKPEDCWLERWSLAAREQGSRALDDLRDGVQKAIELLGTGYLQHPGNGHLRQRLESGDLPLQDLNRQLLRLIYRLLFLFVAEDRNLLLDPQAPAKAKERYREFYSTARLRRLASRMHGTRHDDLYQSLKLLMGFLHDQGAPDLGLPALNSFLWAPEAIADLLDAQISNRQLLLAIRKVAYVERQRSLAPVDFRNLGAEELGAVYEALLELRPTKEGREYLLVNLQGNERKSTGSYYTPTSLINLLLKSALDPVLERAAAHADPKAAEQAILNLKICDPSCGSGHFLVAAGHRVARRLAMVRSGEDEPSPEAVRHALRDVVGHCLYGVDRNDLAVELCKVSLWLEGMEPGRPLSFLEHRVLCGNSLIGATPALLAKGIPEEAFEPLEGDDKKVVASLRKRNRAELAGQTLLNFGNTGAQDTGDLAQQIQGVSEIDDASLEAIHTKAQRYQAYKTSPAYKLAKATADAWCFAFLGLKDDPNKEYITQSTWLALQNNPAAVERGLGEEIARATRDYQFLHWHIEFPDVFQQVPGTPQNTKMGWSDGFDVMLGNPPWERIKIQEKEWFAQNDTLVAKAANAAERKRKIESLRKNNPNLFKQFADDLRRAEGESRFICTSGRYPLGGRGDVNTYVVFAELFRDHLNQLGRAGLIVPSGLATDITTKVIFGDMVATGSLVSFHDFENRDGIFPAVHKSFKFSLVTLAGVGSKPHEPDFVFFARRPENLSEENRHFTLTKADFELISPNTGSCPIFRSKKDAEITKAIYRAVPVLVRDARQDQAEANSWGVSFAAMFHMANDSGLFHSKRQLEELGFRLSGNIYEKKDERFLPLYEGKMIGFFDHRSSSSITTDNIGRAGQQLEHTAEEKADPEMRPIPQYWVSEDEVTSALRGRTERKWLIGFKDVTSSTNRRSFIGSVLPWAGAAHTLPLIFCAGEAREALVLLGLMNSMVFDYLVRQKIGGLHMSLFLLKQTPLPKKEDLLETAGEISEIVAKLVLNATDLAPLSDELGLNGHIYRYDSTERERLTYRLEALAMKAYGLDIEDAEHVIDHFSSIRSDEISRTGEFTTKIQVIDELKKLLGAPARLAVRIDVTTPGGPSNLVKFPFEQLSFEQARHRRDCVPVLTLQAAAGGFGKSQDVEALDTWAVISSKRRVQEGMFVAQVIGKSMEPRIPDGSWCLFQYPPTGNRSGRVLLVQHHGILDPETGGSYTVKKWQSDKVDDGEGGWRHKEIRLVPDNPAFQPIVLTPEDEGEVRVVADFVEVLT